MSIYGVWCVCERKRGGLILVIMINNIMWLDIGIYGIFGLIEVFKKG